KTKDAVTKEVMASYDFVIAASKEMADAKMGEMIKLFNTFDVSRGAAMEKAFEHQTHHRGQATVYLRLKGITPPQEKLF
ncbi:MAG TPA: DinB family protein, partial [Chryseolinea sp.]|nr:DinB family protein [Chryseolinea sp.]